MEGNCELESSSHFLLLTTPRHFYNESVLKYWHCCFCRTVSISWGSIDRTKIYFVHFIPVMGMVVLWFKSFAYHPLKPSHKHGSGNAVCSAKSASVKDSIQLVKRCTKADRKELQKIVMATAIGFAIMEFIGFFTKLIHIPINNIIVGGWVLSHHGTSEPRRGWQPHEVKRSLHALWFLFHSSFLWGFLFLN